MNQAIQTKTTPLVSVIVPCFNHELFLEEAVNSALSSSYPDLEIIIVDDGSKDKSLAIAKELEFKHPFQISVYSQVNSGPSVARNKAISHANGEFILPLDADDKINPDYISKGVKVLEGDRNIKLVYCEAEKFGKKSGHWKLKPYCPNALALDNMIFVSSLFRKSDWMNIGGYDERLKWGWEDWEYWINLLKDGGKVHKLPYVGFYYRIHSVSRRKSVNKKIKKMTLQLLNSKHAGFLNQQLGGPIRNPRSWSKFINKTSQAITYLSAIPYKKHFQIPILEKK
ncbi:glycosyltransferase family 2 protein [Algoriphagus sp. PAP.12]|uniref:glycosyltransferase family 2 protein n=1 Tax=Algoriphagus sp. PAP.12 TaxID=2996678 RepID=UPI00227B66C0|nr:glycosyltransferase family A protein [Algoriphagus sp. PAP.12]